MDDECPPSPDYKPATKESAGWSPKLNPQQQKIFDSHASYVLAYGEKGSGKSIGGLNALVRHSYEENDPLSLIVAPQIRTGKEGVIYDLQWVLDIWKFGNKDKDGNRIDEGIDLEYTEPSLDPQTKDRVLYIGNRHGGWSKVILISIPYAEVVEKRMKALSPSFVYVDEITELDSSEYFTYVSAQIGRRRGISGPQQYVASCNPAGPSHWVYKTFFEECVDQETGVRDDEFQVFHVPITENSHNLPDGYVNNLKRIFRDPVDRERLLFGKWVDRPTGEAIFKNYYRTEIHRRGSVYSKEGLMPHKGYPIIVGHDPGPVNYSGHFMQMIPVKGGQVIWFVFDELNLVGQRRPDFYVVQEILAKMEKWDKYLGGQATFIHIADEAAFSHLRPDGSYDALRMQQLSGGIIKMRSCPKGKDSVAARVRMTTSMLLDQSLFVSALCPKTHEMFQMLVSEKPKGDKYDDEAGFRPKRSMYIHPFDSMTYPPYYFRLLPAAFVLQTAHESSVFRAGGS